MTKEKFIVLDTEGMSGLASYNIGFIIADRYGKIYKEFSYALPENFYTNLIKAIQINQAVEMTDSNIKEILEDSSRPKRKRKYKFISSTEFSNQFLKLISKYKIRKLYAYNVAFDKACLKNVFKDKFEELEKSVEFVDIIPIILRTRLLTKKYVNWALTNGFTTDKGYIQTKAETVYRYLFDCMDFIEEHTALADVKIEYQILLSALKTHKKIDSTNCQAWRELDKFCKSKGIAYRGE